MNNQTILKKRWNKIDKLLSTFFKENKNINKNFYDNLQSILDGIKFTSKDMYNWANINDIGKLHRRILDLKENGNLTGYIGYKLNKLYSKNKLRNSEVLIGLFMIEFYKHNVEQNEIENILFKQIGEITYEEAQKECKKPHRIFTFPVVLTANILNRPSKNGAIWEDFKEGNISYYVNQLFNAVNNTMSADMPLEVAKDGEIKRVLIKYDKSYLNKKNVENDPLKYVDKYSGALDNQVSFFANQVALEGMIRQGTKKVIFIAVEDEKTTNMCQSLDGQIFNINDWNTYDRYSKADDKNVIYKTFGLEVGANMPPIDNGFHYCRSTIYPYE